MAPPPLPWIVSPVPDGNREVDMEKADNADGEPVKLRTQAKTVSLLLSGLSAATDYQLDSSTLVA